MYARTFWIQKIENAWRKRSVVWLTGVRRTGKTFLCKSLPDIEYFDCESPRVRRMLEDPEAFLESRGEKRIVLDEIHRLSDPSQILKLAADHFPKLRILATGSSTLGASARFKDTLTGRKVSLKLVPMITTDMADFKRTDLSRRLLHGGLPPFFLADTFPEADLVEWMDAFWAKDIQELFRLERKYSFHKFIELMMARSGSIFEASRYARECEISRPTISNYLAVLEATHVVRVLRPFSGHRPTEIISAPKTYGFDTGFVCYYRNWTTLSPEAMGVLWEHFVINELEARIPQRALHYWRDKRGHEVDLVLPEKDKSVTALECKWSADAFEPDGMKAFRLLHPAGFNIVVCANVKETYHRKMGDLKITFCGLAGLPAIIEKREK